MKNKYLALIFLFLVAIFVQAQEDGRQLLRGTVLYRNVNVPNENVINITTEDATITDEDGDFAIPVKAGDELAFTSINYSLEIVKVTEAMIQKNRLVVEVNEKVTQLDEVVVSPENQDRFIKMQNEEFKKHDYGIDRSTEVENIATPQMISGMKNGLNFVNIFKALAKTNKNNTTETRPKLKLSEVLRQVYDDEFFVVDLKIPQDKIGEFLLYVDEAVPAQSLLKKTNEFELIDFLVNESKSYREELDAQK
ncbi:hypothetical protein K8352_10670 [Flavobacteriaceae bacterium F89]|uniref:CarboxypepD_reg-like domain-containing protein n=1 Tax=Cerina litoralis TaxID=2874477 RepID=A0AAE3EWX5_9FLAO|nr:hypothetical protein [Cerina litoralis]MCG2461212.1 hypothetical protein [Cerina litoralis]